VVAKWLYNLKSLFSKKENFLVIEILPHHLMRVSLVKADFYNQELYLAKAIEAVATSNVGLGYDYDLLKNLLKKFHPSTKTKIIISLNSNLASTIHSSISLVRNNANEPIDESDLDNLVSQAVWKFFDRHRGKVAQKLGVNDFDVLLADVRILNVKLDGHKVVNPLGFKARLVEVQLCQTFTSRGLINDFKKLLPAEYVELIAESGAIWTHIVHQNRKLPSFLLASIFNQQTILFVNDDVRLTYHDSFEWGGANLVRILTDELKVDHDVSRAILERYISNDTSPDVARKLERLLMRELNLLAAGLGEAMKRSGVRLAYIYADFDLPPVTFSNSFKNRFAFSVKIEPLIHSFISEHYNFDLKFNKRVNMRATFGIFASVLETTLLPYHASMSRMAKRRVRWLSAA